MEKWSVQHLEDEPSATSFKSCIELRNLPVVLGGAVQDWKAFRSWDSGKGGLLYLKEVAGDCNVVAMGSSRGQVFTGELGKHKRTQILFSDFLDLAIASLEGDDILLASTALDLLPDAASTAAGNDEETPSGGVAHQHHLYLAQVPMYRRSSSTAPLRCLMEDISVPGILKKEDLADINMWMSVNGSRSSIHYDPFHNLLCVVVGSKEVMLWPPSAAVSLYPCSIYGESSNHSAVDFAEPDVELHPRFKGAMECSQTVTLKAGDALFIPEGWYHQVNSENVTIAVNFWWPSAISSALGTHMDAYYLRRITARLANVSPMTGCHVSLVTSTIRTISLVDAEKDRMVTELQGSWPADTADKANNSVDGDQSLHSLKLLSERAIDSGKEGSQMQRLPSTSAYVTEGASGVNDLTPTEAQYLITLVLCVASLVENEQAAVDPEATSAGEKLEKTKIAIAKVFSVDHVLLQRILSLLVHQFPRTLETLILYGLSPAAAEILVRKFDKMVDVNTKESQAAFFESFYSVFERPGEAMNEILFQKAQFAAEALKNVMEGMLGLSWAPLV